MRSPKAPPVRQIKKRIPVELGERNWKSRSREYSCWWASTVCMLRHQGLDVEADWIRDNYSGAATVFDVGRVLTKLGVRYVITYRGVHSGADFLEWVSSSQRLAAIHYGEEHAVTFAGFRGPSAIIIENGWPPRAYKIDKGAFIRHWRSGGGYAITALAPPPPPQPWR